MKNRELIAACDRLLATELEVLAMPAEPRDWFMNKPGHRDCFTVARALKELLEAEVERTALGVAEMRKPLPRCPTGKYIFCLSTADEHCPDCHGAGRVAEGQR